MRFRHSDGTTIHLAYCTNVHSAESVDGVVTQLARYSEPVRLRLGADRLGVGLWLAGPVVRQLAADSAALATLRSELDRRGLEVVTLNAFPYAGFHAGSVKKAVYQPDWTDRTRLDYTLACARVLASLLPDDAVRGSVSTLPIAWREPWSTGQAKLALRHLDALTRGLAAVAEDTGRTVRVGLEPEPGCLIETVAQAVELMRGLDTRWLGVCLDTCHVAVGFEDAATATARLGAAGLPIVKTQASCALQIDDPADSAARAALTDFAEQRFLHQTREPTANGLLGSDDLPDALAGALPGTAPWRVHFHVPLHADLPVPLRRTSPELVAALDALFGGPAAGTDHVEVETYTWSVLPTAPDTARLVDGIAAELAWTREALTDLGLKEVN